MLKNYLISASLLTLSLTSVTSLQAEEQLQRGGEILTTVCMVCHKIERGPNMVAPPLFGVKNHYLRQHRERGEFVTAVSEWIVAPNAESSLMAGAVNRFKLMPAQTLSKEDAQAVAGYLYDVNLTEPDWYKEHYQRQHGK